MLEKAKSLEADLVIFDLEDGCAPGTKAHARHLVIDALKAGGFGSTVRCVRVNGWSSPWTHVDVIALLERAGDCVDTIMLPKVEDPAQVVALDLLLTQLESLNGLLVGEIGIEAQIETARGLIVAEQIACASPRVESLVFGPADYMASVQMRSLAVGEQPSGYLSVIHPEQIAIANEMFGPRQDDYDHAENILDAYAWCTSPEGGYRGAAILGGEVIDAGTRKMALVIAAKGRAAGLTRTRRWSAPTEPIG
jgi:citrate lyase subunit beta/citryl-CoA lyase